MLPFFKRIFKVSPSLQKCVLAHCCSQLFNYKSRNRIAELFSRLDENRAHYYRQMRANKHARMYGEYTCQFQHVKRFISFIPVSEQHRTTLIGTAIATTENRSLYIDTSLRDYYREHLIVFVPTARPYRRP
jgi:hypothetical protein